MNSGDSAFVLYIDHEGHPAPLSLSYHATASRRLASSINRHPPSTITEVDSAYCPQCLAFHDATSAASLGYCTKASCRLCPLCRSIATVTVECSECFYNCGLCKWTSKACFLLTRIEKKSDDGIMSLEEVERASAELEAQWKMLIGQRSQSSEDHFKSMLAALTGIAKEQVKGLRSSTNRYFPTVTMKRTIDGPEGWSIQALEDSIEEREKLNRSLTERPVGGLEIPLTSLMVEQCLNESLQAERVDCLLMQDNFGAPTQSMNDLLPLSVPLRPRKSRRCRAELAEGRPGILLKPKLNPLEGDSSLRTGHGQWWKKDSSAIEVLPRIQISIHASDGSRHAFLLKVSNPTLGRVRLRLSGSSYNGEKDWNEETSTSSLLQNILVDPLTQTCVDAMIDPSSAKSFPTTDSCQLEPAEDSFLELGKSNADDIPDDVVKWDAVDILFESKVSRDLPSSMRLVGQKKSFAWFELVLMEPATTGRNLLCAVPLSMQIEVGNGSWDSSLIPTNFLVEGEPKLDYVSFDLLILWEQFN